MADIHNEKVYLTFDMDWVHDDILEWFYGVIKKFEVKATIFVTHRTKWIEIFRKDPDIELGIHPNFNKLLWGDIETADYDFILKDMKSLVPEAVAYRSHALVDGSPIIAKCFDYGIKYNLNMLIQPKKGEKIYPFKRTGMTMVPFLFEDDVWLMDEERQDMDFLIGYEIDMLRVFNFHPIHLWLNTEHISRYSNAKPYYHLPNKMEEYRYDGRDGVYAVFQELLAKAKAKGMKFGLISEI